MHGNTNVLQHSTHYVFFTPSISMVLKRRSVFRPCIDLHNGQVKQIVGGTLSDDAPDALKTNFVSRLVLAMCDETILISNLASPQETSHVYTGSTTSKEDMLSN